MHSFQFQSDARKALQSKAEFVTIIGGTGVGKTYLATHYRREGDVVIDPCEDCTWEKFEARTQYAKRIIVTLNTRLSDAEINDRIKTRIMQGLIATIYEPEELERAECAIMMGVQKAFAETVAKNVPTFPALMGCCKAMVFTNPLCQKAAVAIINNYSLKPLVSKAPLNPTDVFDALITVACDDYSVHPNEVTGTRRMKAFTRPRHLVIYCMKEMTILSLEDVGLYFKGMKPETGLDHSTILHACNNIKKSPSLMVEAESMMRRALAEMPGKVATT